MNAGRASKIAGVAHRRIDAEQNRIAARDFKLRLAACRADDANLFNLSFWPNPSECFIGGKLALLRNVAQLGELIAGAKESFEIGLSYMEVAIGDANGDGERHD